MNEVERNKAMEELVATHGKMVLAIAKGYDANAAEDIRQDAYVKVLLNLDKFDDAKSALATYVSMVTRSVGSDHVKNISKEFNDSMVSFTDLEDSEGEVNLGSFLQEGTDPLDILIAEETEEGLRTAMDDLPPQQHAAFVMRELEGMEYDAIAERIGSTEGSVRVLVHHARATLQGKVAQPC